MRWLAIINPCADHHTRQQLCELETTLRRKLGVATVWTACANQAPDLVAQHGDFDGYIAVGGDGTVAEVVNAIDVRRQALGIIPAGTANDLAHGLHITSEAAGLRAIRRARLHR